MKAKEFAIKYSGCFFFVLLFLCIGMYSVVRSWQIARKAHLLITRIDSLNVQIDHLRNVVEIQHRVLGKRLPTFKLVSYSGSIYTSDKLERSRTSVLLFIVGRCAECFEDEAPLWNQFAIEAGKYGISCIGINIGLPRELLQAYIKAHAVVFPVLEDDGTFSGLFEGLSGLKLAYLKLDSALVVSNVSVSIPEDPSPVLDFCNHVLEKGRIP